MKPDEIERLSFEIIDREAREQHFAADHFPSERFTESQWQVVRRMIHTSADFEFIRSVRIHPRAMEAGIEAIQAGKAIITDTNMAKVGIRQRDLKRFGGEVACLITDPAVAAIAAETGSTRAKAAVDAAADRMDGGLYVVGNAPTALLRLIELIEQKKARPALIIGLPVGFVNAAESKADLVEMDYPHISNVGRKGGSNIAAAVVNALILLAQ